MTRSAAEPASSPKHCRASHKLIVKAGVVAVLFGILSPTLAFSATNDDSRDEKAVLATLEDLSQATMKKNVAALDKIYHPDLTYSHSSALLQTKSEVLKAIARPGFTVESMTFHNSAVRIYGNVALVRGVNDVRDGMPGAVHDNHLNIMWVMLKGPGPHGWQIVARQTTRLPAK